MTNSYATKQREADMRNGRIPSELQYDYDNQCWIRDGFYLDCGHPETMTCTCFGRKHAGDRAPNIHQIVDR